jgi:hypothetical protein
MPKISVMTGLTLPIPGQQYGMLKTEIRFSDIDIDEDVDVQLKRCSEAALAASESSEKTLAQVVADTSGLAVEGTGIVAELTTFKEATKAAVTRLAQEVKRQKDVLEQTLGVLAGGDALAKREPAAPRSLPPDDVMAVEDEQAADTCEPETALATEPPPRLPFKERLEAIDPDAIDPPDGTTKRTPLRKRLAGEPE